MATLKKYDVSGKVLEQIALDDRLVDASVNSQMLKDYIVAIRANARQWSANTKGRSEVNATGKKPHPQKGTGGARQGCFAAPQYRGGGRPFGPKPKFDQHVRINKKERQKVIAALLSQKILDGKVHVLQLGAPMEAPKTKSVVSFLSALGVKEGKRVFFLGQDFDQGEDQIDAFDAANMFILSARNIPGMKFMPASSVSGYDMALDSDLIVMDSALDQILHLLGRVK